MAGRSWVPGLICAEFKRRERPLSDLIDKDRSGCPENTEALAREAVEPVHPTRKPPLDPTSGR